jgi:hypothetical protein
MILTFLVHLCDLGVLVVKDFYTPYQSGPKDKMLAKARQHGLRDALRLHA